MDERLARILTEAREARGWSRTELARRADVDRAHLTRLEQGRRGASLDTLRRLIDALGLDPREVFGEPDAVDVSDGHAMLAAEPESLGYDDPAARLAALRGFASREEAVRVAVEEALARAVAERRSRWSDLLGAAAGPGENPAPRFRSDADLWDEP